MAWIYLGFLILLMGFAYIDYFDLMAIEMLWLDSHYLVIAILLLFLLLPWTIYRHSHKPPTKKSAQTKSS